MAEWVKSKMASKMAAVNTITHNKLIQIVKSAHLHTYLQPAAAKRAMHRAIK